MLLLLLPVALADLPVHCLRHHVEGAWRLHLGPLTPHRTSCGHQSPDTEASQPDRVSFLETAKETFEVMLSSPNVAHPLKESAGKKVASGNGTWTMVYDEGFFLEAAGKQFFAFSHFALSKPASVHDYFQSHVHGKKVYRSICGQTEVGWYQDTESKMWGCFAGERSDVADPAAHHDFLSFLHVPEDPAFHSARSMADHEATAAKLNGAIGSQHLGWEAAAYPSFAGKSFAELNRHAGPPQFAQTRAGKEQVHEKSFMSLVRRQTEVPAKEAAKDTAFRAKFPESLDWRNVSGENWLTPVTDQGDCGSCYVVSSANMLTASNRIQANKTDKSALSISFPLYCNDMNQGCQGGYPFLTALWSQGTGLVTDECADRYHVNDGEQCPAFLSHEDKHHKEKVDTCLEGKELRVDEFGYVGGFYGGCSEEGMMEHLAKGPITIALEPGMDFMYYKSGVYESVKKSGEPIDPVAGEWVKVDHAILMVGWGVDKSGKEEKPYWILQNSWGPDWGEDGYMRIARGIDESGIEFQAVYGSVTETGAKDTLHAFLHA